jgi:hypothetical protein
MARSRLAIKVTKRARKSRKPKTPKSAKPKAAPEVSETPKVGRPSRYSQALADRICGELADGRSLRSVCDADDMPNKATVFRWLREHEEFRDQYARAKQESADSFVDDMIDIADDARNDWMKRQVTEDVQAYTLNGEHVNRTRLRLDTRKWIASKLKPKAYGEKLDLGVGGPNGGAIPFTFNGRLELVPLDDGRPSGTDQAAA